MPIRPLGPCSVRGCSGRAERRGRCARHAAEAEARYREQHPDPRPSAAARGYDGEWRRIRDRYLRRHPDCEAQGCTLPATDVDHVRPRAQGGTDDESNLQALCHRHHSIKTAQHDGAFGNHRTKVER